MKNINSTRKLNNGVEIPLFGLGVFRSENGGEVENAIKYAFEEGYRLIDTASIYKNEEGVGQAILDSNLKREDIFLTSKVWNADQGYESTIKAFEKSLERLQTEYLDLYLIHWPVEGKYLDTWKAMEKLYKDGRIKAIGVSNFNQHHLEDIYEIAEIVPMVNQIELHPELAQPELVKFCENHGTLLQGWSPLMRGKILDIPLLQELSKKYQKNIVQVVLRWHLQKGFLLIPKSSQKKRIQSNANIFDFEISVEDMAQIDLLNCDNRTGPDPENFDF